MERGENMKPGTVLKTIKTIRKDKSKYEYIVIDITSLMSKLSDKYANKSCKCC